MKSKKCKTLWIDDELLKDSSINEIYEIAREKYADKFDIDVVQNVTDFEAKIKTERYDAVIMDVNITEDFCDENPGPMICKISELCSEQIRNFNLRLYAFSGALNLNSKPKKELVELEGRLKTSFKRNPHTGKNFWDKSVGVEIFDDILKDYNERIYAGYDYILDFFSKGWLEKDIKTQFMDPIMRCYAHKDYDSAHGNNMRNVVQPMLERIVAEYEKEPSNRGKLTKKGKDDYGRAAQIAINIAQLDPSSKHMAGPLLHMVNAANAQSHGATDTEERLLFFESDFNTFLLVCKWFFKKMCSFLPAQIDVNAENKPQRQEPILPNKSASKLPNKEYTSIPVRVYTDNSNKMKLEIDVELPHYLINKKPEIVHVISIKPDNNNPKIWFAVIDKDKPFYFREDRPHTAT